MCCETSKLEPIVTIEKEVITQSSVQKGPCCAKWTYTKITNTISGTVLDESYEMTYTAATGESCTISITEAQYNARNNGNHPTCNPF